MKPTTGCEGQNRQISGSPSDKRIPETIGNKLFNFISKDMLLFWSLTAVHYFVLVHRVSLA